VDAGLPRIPPDPTCHHRQGTTMSQKNLSTVTTDLIESYGNTAKNVIQAYRVGNQRAVQFIDQRWEKALQQSAAQLRTEVRENALTAQKTISGIYIKGIDLTSNGADAMVNKAVELAGKGVQRVAVNASAFEKRTGVATLNSLAKATVPAVIAASTLAGKLEQGSSSLANTVAGKKAKVKVAAVKRNTVRKNTAAKKAVAKGVTRKSPVRKRTAGKTAAVKTTARKSTAAPAAA
jgi:hypothetical protein